LNSEEKFFEKAVITEKFVKKYKNAIIGTVVAVIVVAVANIAYEINKQGKIDAANEALAQLEKGPNNVTALSRLESLSPDLHDVWLYSKALADKDTATLQKLKDSKAMLVADLARYELASESNDVAKLSEYSLRQNAIYKDLAYVQSAVILMNEGKTDEAHQKLSLISEQSPLSEIAKALRHYGVK
jgi:hypothetical protein